MAQKKLPQNAIILIIALGKFTFKFLSTLKLASKLRHKLS